MFQMAILNSGFLVENPMDLTEPLEKLIKVGFGLARDEPVEDIEVELDDDEEEGDFLTLTAFTTFFISFPLILRRRRSLSLYISYQSSSFFLAVACP